MNNMNCPKMKYISQWVVTDFGGFFLILFLLNFWVVVVRALHNTLKFYINRRHEYDEDTDSHFLFDLL